MIISTQSQQNYKLLRGLRATEQKYTIPIKVDIYHIPYIVYVTFSEKSTNIIGIPKVNMYRNCTVEEIIEELLSKIVSDIPSQRQEEPSSIVNVRADIIDPDSCSGNQMAMQYDSGWRSRDPYQASCIKRCNLMKLYIKFFPDDDDDCIKHEQKIASSNLTQVLLEDKNIFDACDSDNSEGTEEYINVHVTKMKDETFQRIVMDTHCHLEFIKKRFRRDVSLNECLELDGEGLGSKFHGAIVNFWYEN